MMFSSTVCAALLISAAAAPINTDGAVDVDFEKLRTSMFESQVFQEKVEASCAKSAQQEECATKAKDLLMCELLRRSKPKVAEAHCSQATRGAAFLQTRAPAAPVVIPKATLQTKATTVSDMKARILQSSEFRQQTERLSGVFGCNGVKKVGACAGYVQDIAFCLEFANKLSKFANMAGVEDEKNFCKHVDEKLPKLSLLLQQKFSFAQVGSRLRKKSRKAPEDDLAKEMTHDLEMNFNKIAPFGKEDTAKELQDHAAKTQDTLVDAVENAEVAEIKRAVFRALTRLRAATIKEFDTIARLETQAIDAYNDAHHYRAENPLAHLHEDEAPVETDKLKSFH